MELKNSPYGNDWYYYFYNWDVNPLACESPLTPYEITVVSCASVDENVLSVKIYPNPTTEIITIDGVANGVFSLIKRFRREGEIRSVKRKYNCFFRKYI